MNEAARHYYYYYYYYYYYLLKYRSHLVAARTGLGAPMDIMDDNSSR